MDGIHHHCGIALLCLRKGLGHYYHRYGSLLYGLERLYVMMYKQYNRGQDGAGIAGVKKGLLPGIPYLNRLVRLGEQALGDVFKELLAQEPSTATMDAEKVEAYKQQLPFLSELLMGHLRYGTYGGNSVDACHPFVRSNNWRVRNLAVAGNFNMTNNSDLFKLLLSLGQHPTEQTDMVMVMEKIGHFLDEEVQTLYNRYRDQLDKKAISQRIEQELDILRVLGAACHDFDGGYVFTGLLGHGAAFAARDASGIRPAYYYIDEEVIAVTSERPALQAAFGARYEDIQELPPAHALCIRADASYELGPFMDPQARKPCAFERIYFARAADPAIYQERKQLGRLLAPSILSIVAPVLQDTVFSYIPNTAEVAFLGLIEGVSALLAEQGGSNALRVEKLIFKDRKLRTFISQDKDRGGLIQNIYDTVAYTSDYPIDTLVIMDDSIVRCSTLEQSILALLGRLSPKRIIILSSAPQVRYPDCYGIDMSRLQDFVAFRAAVALLEENNMTHILDEVAQACEINSPDQAAINPTQAIYAPFSAAEISKKIAQIIRPTSFGSIDNGIDLQIIFQRIENLHQACPDHQGDWCFSGNYPTPGGNVIAKKSFLHYRQGLRARAY